MGFVGGTVSSEQLSTGVHYYVCQPHASLGMKGRIVVKNTTGIPVNPLKSNIAIYPNPSNGKFQVDVAESQLTNNYSVEIFDARGQKKITSSKKSEQTSVHLDLSEYPSGIYFVQLFEGNLLCKRKIIIQYVLANT